MEVTRFCACSSRLLCVVAFYVQRHDHVVHGADDVLLHGPQGVVQFLDDRVVLAAVVHQGIAFELGRIVEIDLALDVHVADSRVGRDQVGVLGRIGQVVLDELGQTELCLQFQGVDAVFLRFGHVHPRRRGDVYDLVSLFERLEIRLHAAQFALDDDQTLVDEIGRIDRHLVLVPYGLLVIDEDERVEHIFGPGRRVVLQGKGEDG